MAKEKVKASLSGGTAWRNKSEDYRKDTLAKMLSQSRLSLNGNVSNAEFARTDKVFRDACEKVGIEPTARQASKFRNQIGKAYLEGR